MMKMFANTNKPSALYLTTQIFDEFLLKKISSNYLKVQACVQYFCNKFLFSSNNSPSKTMKDAFYFIQKALFVL